MSQPLHSSEISLHVDGSERTLTVDHRMTLLDALRERLDATAPKKGCDHGQCGSCTILVEGRRVTSCLTFAVAADGAHITTAAGLGDDEALHPVAQAFHDEDAFQCGYCTPGQIMAAIACVNEGNATSPERIREYMSGNICRCGAYVGIVAAIEDAAERMEAS